MNFYYCSDLLGLRSSVTLCNFSPVQSQQTESQNYFIYAACSHNTHWELENLGKLEVNQAITLSRKDTKLSLSEKDQLIFFLYPDLLTSKLQQLPSNDHMQTSPAWRANLRLSSKTTSVSFQGEYPGEMTKIPKGSLLSIAPMSLFSKDTISKLIIVNISSSPSIEKRELWIGTTTTKKRLATFELLTNSSNIIPLSEIDKPDDELIAIVSPDMAGVPMYLNHNEDYSEMSLEHSHPPIELTIFGEIQERQKIVKNMKSYWIQSFKDCSA